MRTIKAGLLLALLALPVAAQAQSDALPHIDISARQELTDSGNKCVVNLWIENRTNKTVSLSGQIEIIEGFRGYVRPFAIQFVDSDGVKFERIEVAGPCRNKGDVSRVIVREISSCKIGKQNFSDCGEILRSYTVISAGISIIPLSIDLQ